MSDEVALLLIGLWIGFVFWSVTRIRYAVDEKFLRILWLGVTVRRIALSDIEDVSTRCAFWNEHWMNTFWPFGRIVNVRRKSGLIRNFVITPSNRDAFIEELKAKIRKLEQEQYEM